jgi:hypothetical protein
VGSFSVSKPLAAVLLAGCLALIASNVLLARRLSQLKQLDDFLNAANKLELGGVVPPLVGYDISGNKVTYEYGRDSRETLLLVFSPTCHACDENWPKWNRLIQSVDTRSTRLVIANISGAPVSADYVARHNIAAVPLVAEVSAESQQAYRLAYTPQTILIGSDGKVRKVHTGVLAGSTFVLNLGCTPASDPHCGQSAGSVASVSR